VTISLRLYGELKRKVRKPSRSDTNPGSPKKITLTKEDNISTINNILKKFDLKPKEISHMFVNGKYCGPGKELRDGDRVALFPTNMGLIFAEIEKNHPIPIKIHLPKPLEAQINKSKEVMRVPKGSNVGYVLKRFNLLKDLDRLEISVNELASVDEDYILQENDIVRISSS
jgi:molybdopterin converting factor small subunit